MEYGPGTISGGFPSSSSSSSPGFGVGAESCSDFLASTVIPCVKSLDYGPDGASPRLLLDAEASTQSPQKYPIELTWSPKVCKCKIIAILAQRVQKNSIFSLF